MVTFILHTHLPYVLHHGTWPHGSDWLCEAVAECYIPLLRMCDRLVADGIRPGITFDISPVLCEQLSHPDFPEIFEHYCQNHADLAEADATTLSADGIEDVGHLPGFWNTWYLDRLDEYVKVYSRDIIGAFKKLQDDDAIELMTCGLTHGYFPLLAEDSSIDIQTGLAVASYKKHFGRKPRGMWLPECAYRPSYPWRTYLPVSSYSVAQPRMGVEEIIRNHGIEYFVTDQGALDDATTLSGQPTSVFSLYNVGHNQTVAPVAVFTRHRDIAMQVWSGDSGYPGDPDYLDFHKKYYKSAIRYWRVTDNKADMQYKLSYQPRWASDRAKDHAEHFAEILEVSLKHRMGESDNPATLCLPFDTELFGHWWFEGPQFLEHVLRRLNGNDERIATTSTASEQIDAQPYREWINLPESSWGKNGHHEVWMNDDVQWSWEKEYKLEYRLKMLLEKHNSVVWDENMKRIMKNGLRQLLLAQASDWQFLISTFSSREYAEMRFHNHAEDSARAFQLAEKYAVTNVMTSDDEIFLSKCEKRDGIFEEELDGLWSSPI